MIVDEEGKPSGCLIVNSSTELAAHDLDVDTKSVESFITTEELFQKIIIWGQQNEEFSSDLDAKEMAEYLNALSIGVRVMARTSISKEKLNNLVNTSIRLLKGY